MSAGKIGGGCSGTSGQKESCSDADALCMTTGQVMTCSESLSVCSLSIIFVFLLSSCVCPIVCLSVPFCLFSHFFMCLQSHPASPSHLSVSHPSGPLPVYVSVTLTSVHAVGLTPLLFLVRLSSCLAICQSPTLHQPAPVLLSLSPLSLIQPSPCRLFTCPCPSVCPSSSPSIQPPLNMCVSLLYNLFLSIFRPGSFCYVCSSFRDTELAYRLVSQAAVTRWNGLAI